jgi:Domain of unknown function (DUF4838)
MRGTYKTHKLFIYIAVLFLLMSRQTGYGAYYKIVKPEPATKIQSLAASELGAFCRKIFKTPIVLNGVKTKLVFYIGYSKSAKESGFAKPMLNDDEFSLELRANKLLMTGFDDCDNPFSFYGRTGTLSAIYYFLTKFCRVDFFFPGKYGIYLPENPSLNIPEGIVIKPSASFKYRGITFNKGEFNKKEQTLFSRRLLCSRFELPPYGQRYKFKNWKKRFWQDHPDYFCQESCQPVYHPLTHPNPCFSNPAVVKQVAEDVISFFDKHPTAASYRLFEDLPYRPCQCRRCHTSKARQVRKPGDYGEEYFGFVSKIAHIVDRKYPNRKLIVNTKSNYSHPPTLIKIPPNIIINFISRYRLFDQTIVMKRLASLKEWRKHGATIYFRSYARMPKYKDYPIMNHEHLSDYIRSSEGLTSGLYKSDAAKNTPYAFSALNNYLQAKLLFESSESDTKLIRRFLAFNFPGAESEMLKFYQLMEQNWTTQPLAMTDPLISIYRYKKLQAPWNNLVAAEKKITKKGYLFKELYKKFQILYQLSKEQHERYKMAQAKVINLKSPKQPIIIDGDLVDNEWQQATEISLTELVKPISLAKAQAKSVIDNDSFHPAIILLTMDKHNLYIAIKAFEPEIDKLRHCVNRDGDIAIRYDDTIDIYIAPENASFFYRLQYNTMGFYSLRKQRNINDITEHHSEISFSHAVKIAKNYFVMEFKFPFEQFNLSADGIKLNIIRNRLCLPVKFDWKDLKKRQLSILSIGRNSPYDMSSACTIKINQK